MAADINQQPTWSQFRGPGAKLFLVNTNNISNNSINLDNHNLSDFELGLVPK